MKVHRLERTHSLRTSPTACWEFFSNPKNLKVITPPHLNFMVKSELTPEIYEGQFIEYQVHPFLGIPLTWVTEITYVRAPYYFCDEQRVGPYHLWHHEHFFTPQKDGTVITRDLIHYVLPLSPWSEIVHPFIVAPQLREIFAFRQQKMLECFPP
jgi:ligand-binding SRPBCC domain-containing protein